jgi:DNA (cytosine-5)-methyltransferase 1
MKYISICSGIEAATTAWHGLGWQPLAFSEIDAFPSAVLAERYPQVPNLGDMSKFREWPEELLVECELLVGGTPCQAFSVAGLRKSLDDERGNLSLIYVQLFHHINEIRRKHGRSPAIALWENVPGVLSTKDNAFGCFISGLLGVDDTIEVEGGKWPKAGFLGSKTVRVGYRVLDAQYFAVAQRRRRVFLVAVPCELVASLGERACPSEILSLRESVLGNPPTRGEARQAVARGSAERAASGGEPVAFGGNRTSGPVDVATSCLANGSPHGRMDFASETFVVEGENASAAEDDDGPDEGWLLESTYGGGLTEAVAFKPGQSEAAGGTFVTEEFAPTIQGQNNGSTAVPAVAFKPSHYTRGKDGKDGKPAEVVPPLSADADKGDQDTLVMRQSIGFNWQNGGGYGAANDGLGITEEGTGPLSRSQVPACVTGQRTHALTTRAAAVEEDGTGRGTPIIPAVFTKAKRAQSENDDESWVPGEVAPTQNQFDVGDTRATTVVAFQKSDNDGAFAFSHSADANSHGIACVADGSPPIRGGGGGNSMPAVCRPSAMQVRRLTPTECCRLQGFPDDHCDIVYRKKPAADGPKYRALGNSMAVPCMAWLGWRIHEATGGDNS